MNDRRPLSWRGRYPPCDNAEALEAKRQHLGEWGQERSVACLPAWVGAGRLVLACALQTGLVWRSEMRGSTERMPVENTCTKRSCPPLTMWKWSRLGMGNGEVSGRVDPCPVAPCAPHGHACPAVSIEVGYPLHLGDVKVAVGEKGGRGGG